MNSGKRAFLRCFCILIASMLVGLLYFTGMLSRRQYSSVWNNNTLISLLHNRNLTSQILGIGDEEIREYVQKELAREAARLNSVVSKSENSAPGLAVSSLPGGGELSELDTNLASFKDYAVLDDIPKVKVEAVSCSKLVEGDVKEQMNADSHQKEFPKHKVTDDQIFKQAQSCTTFISDRQYVSKPVSDEEAKYPIAFSILLFQDTEQFERLLRAIYRPQNFYCVHVDKNAPKSVQDAVGSVVNCFGNVFLAPEQFEVHWGTFSILEPELSCMKELLKYKKWKYFINLTGQEFPLKTNWEMVQILKIFNGANNLEGTVKRRNPERTSDRPPPPANITVTKGSVHIVASRKFVRFIVYNETSLKFRDWVKSTSIPDETYFSSLNFNPHLQAPGSYLGIPETDTKKNLFITRFKNWGDGPFDWPCGGKRVRMVCIFAVRDLPLLATRPELFANKFYLDYEPLALDCLEELHYNRTRLQIALSPDIDKRFYKSLDFVQNHL